jgi:hypothetical protein
LAGGPDQGGIQADSFGITRDHRLDAWRLLLRSRPHDLAPTLALPYCFHIVRWELADCPGNRKPMQAN